MELFYTLRLGIVMCWRGLFFLLWRRRAEDKRLVYQTVQDLTPAKDRDCTFCTGLKCPACAFTGRAAGQERQAAQSNREMNEWYASYSADLHRRMTDRLEETRLRMRETRARSATMLAERIARQQYKRLFRRGTHGK